MMLTSSTQDCQRLNCEEFSTLRRQQAQHSDTQQRGDRDGSVGAPAPYRGNVHVYHSLLRFQLSDQKISVRSASDMRPRRTPARTLMV